MTFIIETNKQEINMFIFNSDEFYLTQLIIQMNEGECGKHTARGEISPQSSLMGKKIKLNCNEK